VIQYGGDKIKAVKRNHEVEVTLGNHDWDLDLAGPKQTVIKVGEFMGAKRSAFSGDSPGLDFNGMGRGSNELSGKFVVWELEFDGDKVKRLAVDFYQQCEGTMPPLYGVVRFNSKFQ
jgi:hypothetical protein